MDHFEQEIEQGRRFPFGRNWARFLSVLTDERIQDAENSLRQMLQVDTFTGKRFLDVGSGSGLFSLAARRLGAAVTSFDFDPDSVECTRELKRRYFLNDGWWIARGSVLDRPFLKGLGTFDVVYAWGVLHHTGHLWQALENVSSLVAPQGSLLVAIYNDQGRRSRFWLRIKQAYCSGLPGRVAVCSVFIPLFIAAGIYGDLRRGRNPITRYGEPTLRGMSGVRDWFDWLGGLPYEVARPEQVVAFYEARGFLLKKLQPTGGLGNNQFAFLRSC